jgi:hypothetical protein
VVFSLSRTVFGGKWARRSSQGATTRVPFELNREWTQMDTNSIFPGPQPSSPPAKRSSERVQENPNPPNPSSHRSFKLLPATRRTGGDLDCIDSIAARPLAKNARVTLLSALGGSPTGIYRESVSSDPIQCLAKGHTLATDNAKDFELLRPLGWGVENPLG